MSARSPAAVCCDLDGVVWRGDAALPGAADAMALLRGAGVRTAFVTNNSHGTRSGYASRLARIGIPAEPSEVLSSAVAAAALLAGEGGAGERRGRPDPLPPGARVLACAGPGVREALNERGYEAVDAPPAEAVVVGWHREFDFDRLATAAEAVRDGARFVATNLDPTYPAARGLLPGNGALVAAVATAADRRPEVAGKPYPAMVALVRRLLGDEGVVVGDRPSTDGAFAAALGWPFALVLSGVGGPGAEEPVPDPPPALMAADLAALAPELVDLLAGC